MNPAVKRDTGLLLYDGTLQQGSSRSVPSSTHLGGLVRLERVTLRSAIPEGDDNSCWSGRGAHALVRNCLTGDAGTWEWNWHRQLEAVDPGENVQALFLSPRCDMSRRWDQG